MSSTGDDISCGGEQDVDDLQVAASEQRGGVMDVSNVDFPRALPPPPPAPPEPAPHACAPLLCSAAGGLRALSGHLIPASRSSPIAAPVPSRRGDASRSDAHLLPRPPIALFLFPPIHTPHTTTPPADQVFGDPHLGGVMLVLLLLHMMQYALRDPCTC